MNVNEIRIKHASMLLEFMDGGEVYNRRTGWPVRSMRNREPFTASEQSSIDKRICPRCGGRIREEIDICNGELGRFIQCVSCARDWTTPEPEIPVKFTKFPCNFGHKKRQRTFKCLQCGKEVSGMFSHRQKFCPDDTCYRDYQRIYQRELYRKHNNLSRYLGVER
jgi:hypothetical protein